MHIGHLYFFNKKIYTVFNAIDTSTNNCKGLSLRYFVILFVTFVLLYFCTFCNLFPVNGTRVITRNGNNRGGKKKIN